MCRKFVSSVAVVAGLFFVCASISNAKAEPLSELLPKLLKDHERIKAANLDLEASKQSIRVAQGDYLPTVDFTGNFGHENQNKATGSDDTSTGFNEASLSAEQLIWDFGKTFGQIDRAKLAHAQSAMRLKTAEQALIREALSAYLNLVRVAETLRFAQQSEANIRNQTKLEDALVQRRSGLATDVLQAKAALAGAQATRVRTEGALANAISRYRAVFRSEPGKLDTFTRPRLAVDKLPSSIDDAIKMALDNNLDLKIARINYDIAKKTTEINRATMVGPEVNLVAETNYKRNVSGTLDTKIEKLVKVEGTFSFFSGFKDIATYQGSLKSASAASNREVDLRRSVEERVRVAWQNLQTQQTNAQFLRNQSNIAGEFLEKARKERQLGNRSLVDILSQETAFINSVSAALSAETDTAIAFYDVLFAMSMLNLEVFKEQPKAQ